ncbi:hypothetical protein NQ317_019361 [Molorchus minor]|uniref:Uncharacterized protein n=1 Tax=Molorchus minor TaxID=1323400 RepID=A0ABQ9J8X1_9CUCU|nr:hypothetical protein NQ317_019361 [Molorchus minor]
MGEGECETTDISKKGRHRKKQLYNSILRQMEFYFSDSNLSKDRFLSKLLNEDQYVDIKVFFNFNKIRKLSCTLEDICKAISKSELIELSDDKQKIRRKTPFRVKENEEECTIYVENINGDANHDWLKQVFSDFGNVVYVSIPKYKQNKGNKGFAFIEFETEKEAQNALAYFENIGCKMPANTSPEKLRSILTFESDNLTTHSDENDKNNETRKLSIEEPERDKRVKTKSNVENDSPGDAGKKKITEVDLGELESNKVIRTANIEMEDSENEKKNVKQEKKTTFDTDIDDTENKKKKKHKKDKRRSYLKELGLQVLSKKEWKKMRNQYLDLQKKKMKEFKHYLQKHNKKFDKVKKTAKEQNTVEEAVPKLEFTPGVIVKIKLPEPCVDMKKLKNDISTISPDVKYVDIPLTAGGEEVYVRFSNCECAKDFCSQEFIGERTILKNEEEKDYWDKIQMSRVVKFTKSAKKQRGRDKLLKKAEKERAKHLRFEENE